MYTKGTKKNSYKPFVFLAELHLLKYLGFMDENNINNCIKLMESSDKENLFVASQVIQFYRKERIKKLGEFTHTKIKTIRNYSEVLHDYDSEIVNATIWNNKKKLETND
jgi:isoprenylcysteine carboxyl methyltransferase (ICMT) family protein YpbQ